MGRLLFFLLVGLVVVWWIFGRTKKRTAESRKAPPQDSKAALADEMVVCAHCGVHLPRGEALVERESIYCGDEHRRLGPRHP